MSEIEIGKVTHYYDRLHVAVLKLAEPIKVGDTVHVSGHNTELVQKVESLQIDHEPVTEAAPGSDVAMRVDGLVHEHDHIYRVTAA
jgi:putative protease